jgi:hypothetical protein
VHEINGLGGNWIRFLTGGKRRHSKPSLLSHKQQADKQEIFKESGKAGDAALFQMP